MLADQWLNNRAHLGGTVACHFKKFLNNLVFIINQSKRLIDGYCGNPAEHCVRYRLENKSPVAFFDNVAIQTQCAVYHTKGFTPRQLFGRIYGNFLLQRFVCRDNYHAGPVRKLLNDAFHLDTFEVHELHRPIRIGRLIRLRFGKHSYRLVITRRPPPAGFIDVEGHHRLVRFARQVGLSSHFGFIRLFRLPGRGRVKTNPPYNKNRRETDYNRYY